MPEFFQTRMGAKFYEIDVPNFVESLASIARSLQLIAGSATRKVAASERPTTVWLIQKTGRPTVVVASARAVSWLVARQIDEDFEGKTTPTLYIEERQRVLDWGEHETRESSGEQTAFYGFSIRQVPIVDYR